MFSFITGVVFTGLVLNGEPARAVAVVPIQGVVVSDVGLRGVRGGLFSRRAERRAGKCDSCESSTETLATETITPAEIRVTEKFRVTTQPAGKNVRVVPTGATKSVAPSKSVTPSNASTK